MQAWLTRAFAQCNERVSERLSRLPTTHEVSLDMSFIEHFSNVPSPTVLPSGWLVQLSTHFLGGGRHFGDWPDWPRRWEIADIGFLVQFRRGGKLIRSKVALLQSKRLYPDELEWDEDSPLDYVTGFSRLMRDDEDWAVVTEPRRFVFSDKSRYQALMVGHTQYEAIAKYEARNNIPVYYLLYHPRQVPSETILPLSSEYVGGTDCPAGCRVVPAQDLRTVLRSRQAGEVPAYGDLTSHLRLPHSGAEHQAGWRLEHFVVGLLLECETGYIANSRFDQGLQYIFTRRTGPISAAISLTLDAPG